MEIPDREPGRKRLPHLAPLEFSNQPILQFVTVCVDKRRPLLARPEIVELLINCWCNADQWIVGRWVVMPDPPPFVLRACDFPTRSAQVMDAILAERKHPALATFCQEAHLAKRGFRPPTSRWRKLPPKMALSLEKLDPAGIGSKTGGLALSR